MMKKTLHKSRRPLNTSSGRGYTLTQGSMFHSFLSLHSNQLQFACLLGKKQTGMLVRGIRQNPENRVKIKQHQS